jgi:hypothetical protein
MPSTAIEWVNWRDRVLSVKYVGGDAYDYLDVPEDIYRQYRAARSKGQFINFVVKPHFAYRRRTPGSKPS